MPGSFILIDDSPVEVVVSAGKNIERSENLHSEFVTILDEITHHIIVTGTLDTFPLTHIRSDFAVIQNLAHNGFYVNHGVVETEVAAFLKIESD